MFFLVRDNAEVKLTGPCKTWQEACLVAFGCIDKRFSVKIVGSQPLTKKQIQQSVNNKQDWFSPYLPNGANHTFIASQAMGPPEISAEMLQLGNSIKTAKTEAEIEVAHSLGLQYLRYLPLKACACFDDLYRIHLTRVMKHEENA